MPLPKCSGHLEHAEQGQTTMGELAELAESLDVDSTGEDVAAQSLAERPLEAQLEDAKEVPQPKMLQEDLAGLGGHQQKNQTADDIRMRRPWWCLALSNIGHMSHKYT